MRRSRGKEQEMNNDEKFYMNVKLNIKYVYVAYEWVKKTKQNRRDQLEGGGLLEGNSASDT